MLRFVLGDNQEYEDEHNDGFSNDDVGKFQ